MTVPVKYSPKGSKGTDPQYAHVTFDTRRAVQSALADLLVGTVDGILKDSEKGLGIKSTQRERGEEFITDMGGVNAVDCRILYAKRLARHLRV